MFRVPSIAAVLGLALCLHAPQEAISQQFDESGVVFEAARNKIGLILYCRKNALLDPAKADQAVTAIEAGLRNVPVSSSLAARRGKRAQQAGENGFWDTGRKHNISSIAKQFRTTPKDLCVEWASETVRAHGVRPPMQIETAAILKPALPKQPLPQDALKPPKSVLPERPPAGAATAPAASSLASVPPMPEKAPSASGTVKAVSLPRPPKTGGNHAGATGRTAPASAAPLADPAQNAASRKKTVADNEPQRQRFARRSRLDWLERYRGCWMPGCRWPTPQERRARRY